MTPQQIFFCFGFVALQPAIFGYVMHIDGWWFWLAITAGCVLAYAFEEEKNKPPTKPL